VANDLVSASEAQTTLGLGAADTDLTALVDQVVARFAAECGREDAPFRTTQTARTERIDGVRRGTIHTAYPISALTSVKLGYDSTDPDETLDVADPDVIQIVAGTNRIARVDGGIFGPSVIGHESRFPGYVQVVYNAAADLPLDAKRACLREIARIWRQRGAEDAAGEGFGGIRTDLSLAVDPTWKDAVAMHRRIHL